MSTAVTRALIVIGALLVLASVNWSIYGKEQIIRTGEPIYLELAPVDPRSLMQGDYMALRFELSAALADGVWNSPATTAQFAPVVLDDRRVATLAKPGGRSDLLIRYRMRDGAVWLGTNAYFFEEGTAYRYAEARYGEFRVDRASGEAVLVALRDEQMRSL